MNMNDWQNQQRIQKEKERIQKTEAAESLRSHRGGVKEDDAHFSAMRAEERKKQQEAEALRHNYRGKSNPNTEAKAKPVRQDPTHPPPVNANAMHMSPRAEVGNLCAPGSVSAMAGKFKSLDTPVSELEGSGSTLLVESTTEEKKMEGEPASAEMTENETIPMPQEQESVTIMDTPSPVQADEELQPAELAVDLEEKQVEPEAPEEPEIVMEPEIAMDKPKEDEPEEAVATTTMNRDAFLDPQDEPLQGHPTVVRLDVLFSFGLVTTKKEPSFAGYLVATEDIIKETLQQNAELSEHVSYDSMYGPFVQECSVDGKSAHCTSL
jgi:hypothetical protein